MHGRLKVRTSAEQQAIKAQERACKLKLYQAAVGRIFSKRKAEELDDEILHLTSQVLLENPDIYTLWNIRKETIEQIKKEKPEALDSYVAQELALTEKCIRVNPKSYNSWFQRSWVLDYGSNIDFDFELHLCNKCLDLDERNFHCWDYRRIIASKANVSPENEFEFSTARIEKNFSNYSSWHYRSELLPRIYPSPDGNSQLIASKLDEECKLIQNAIFTDPNDQSSWFYQRWLLFQGENQSKDKSKAIWRLVLQNELEACQQLYDLEPENKWVMLQMCEILRRLDSKAHETEILGLIDKLKKVDPLRQGYYKYYGLKIKEESHLNV